ATGLPNGLSVNPSNGLISGTPTTASNSSITLSAANAGGTGTATLTLTINNASTGHVFYIDWVSGSDFNIGTSTSTPWKRAPGMQGFAGTYTHAAGDRFIFKGGVTWPSSVFSFVIGNSGTSVNRDYFGVDQTFFSGASWTRPIFDGGGGALA